jgi:hypothetical protein
LVLLRHDTPDGAHHYDLMLERRAGDGRLLTMRLDRRIDVGVAGRAEGEMLGEHRRVYLDYEGEVSGGRGRVVREWADEGELGEESPGVVRVRIGGGGEIEMRRDGSVWRVEVRPDKAEHLGMGEKSMGRADDGGDGRE